MLLIQISVNSHELHLKADLVITARVAVLYVHCIGYAQWFFVFNLK